MEEVNMGVINIINNALNDALSRKETVEKQIIDTSVMIAKLETEPEVASIFRQRLRTLENEKKELLITIDSLRERAIKFTFNNYTYTDSKTDVDTTEKVEEIHENQSEIGSISQNNETPAKVVTEVPKNDEVASIYNSSNNINEATISYVEQYNSNENEYEEEIEYIKPKIQSAASSESNSTNQQYKPKYEYKYNDEYYEDEEEIIDAKNIKIFYNSGGYQISFDLIQGDEVTPIKFRRSVKLNLNNDRKIRSLSRQHRVSYEHCKDLDINIYELLRCKVDKVYGTDLAKRYFRNKLKARIVYNFNKLSNKRKSKWSLAEKWNQYFVALRQQKKGVATIYHPKKALATLIVGASLLVGAAAPQIKRNIDEKINSNSIEQTVNTEALTENTSSNVLDKAKEEIEAQKATTESEKELLANIKEKELEIESSLPIINPKFKIDNVSLNSYGQVQATEEVTEEVTEEATTEEKKKNGDNLGIGIGDRIKLVYTSESGDVSKTYPLYTNAYCEGESILASKIECDYFKVSCIAVYKDGKTLDIIRINAENEEMRTNDIYKKYGSDVEISFNFDAYEKDSDIPKNIYIGWLNIDELAYFTDEQKENITTSQIEEKNVKKLILTQNKNRLF